MFRWSILLLGLSASPTLSDVSVNLNIKPVTGEEFFKSCQTTDQAEKNLHASYFIGMWSGMREWDRLLANNMGITSQLDACLPEGVQYNELYVITCEFIAQHPQDAHWELPALTAYAVQSFYKCPVLPYSNSS